MGGGIVSGSVTLVGGDPGIGKSTILIQAISNLTRNLNTLYISGENPEQIKLRAERLKLKLDQINIITEVNLELIIETFLNQKPDLVVIDSIQTLLLKVFLHLQACYRLGNAHHTNDMPKIIIAL